MERPPIEKWRNWAGVNSDEIHWLRNYALQLEAEKATLEEKLKKALSNIDKILEQDVVRNMRNW